MEHIYLIVSMYICDAYMCIWDVCMCIYVYIMCICIYVGVYVDIVCV